MLAQLTPVNFLFYGVPTEVMDEVLARLLSCAVGLAARRGREDLPPLLYAVDREITEGDEPREQVAGIEPDAA